MKLMNRTRICGTTIPILILLVMLTKPGEGAAFKENKRVGHGDKCDSDEALVKIAGKGTGKECEFKYFCGYRGSKAKKDGTEDRFQPFPDGREGTGICVCSKTSVNGPFYNPKMKKCQENKPKSGDLNHGSFLKVSITSIFFSIGIQILSQHYCSLNYGNHL